MISKNNENENIKRNQKITIKLFAHLMRMDQLFKKLWKRYFL